MDPFTIAIIVCAVAGAWLVTVWQMRNRAEREGKQLTVSLLGNTFSYK